jgi:hypothetical protein
VFSVLTLKPYDFYMKPEMKGHFELASWFHAPGSRAALKAGTGTVTTCPTCSTGPLRTEFTPTDLSFSSAPARPRTSMASFPSPSRDL